MERDPLRYVWKESRLAHLAALLAVLALVPVTWLSFSLPRTIIDDALIGAPFRAARTAPFLRTVLDLPYPYLDEPWVIFKGLPLDRWHYLIAACAVLGLVFILRTLLLGGLGILRSGLGRRLAGRLRSGLFRKIAHARVSAREETIQAADLAGGGVSALAPFLGDALIMPVLAGSEIVLIVVFALWTHLGLGLAALLIALAHMAAMGWYAANAMAKNAAHATRERELARAVLSAAKRARAIRIHGTAALEERTFRATLDRLNGAWRGFGRKLVLANMARGLVREGALAVILAVGGLFTLAGVATPGGVVAVALAVLCLPRPVASLVEWRARRTEARVAFDEMARTVGALQARRRRDEAPAKLERGVGPLVAEGLTALDPGSGVRLSCMAMQIDLPAHLALIGDDTSGAAVLAGLIGGAVEPSGGVLTIDGVDLARLDGTGRVGLIAQAGAESVLLDGTLRDNLTYGAHSAVDDDALIAALTVSGLDDQVYGFGLLGTLDGDPNLPGQIVEARRAVHRMLAAEGHSDFVDPFDASAYNRHATIAENLLFGVPVGDTFREANLPRHPYMRAVLETEGLAAPFADMGLSIARAMVEIFDGVPDGHPLFERYSFFSAGERGAYEELVARQSERRRGVAAQRDRDLLVALALRYVETRHRLGLLDPSLEERIVAARASFRKMLPRSLGPSVEFYDPDRVCNAASLADNLLFGRPAHNVAGAEERVRDVIRHVLAERGLDAAVFRIGLSTPVGPRDPNSLDARVVALDLARCVLRRPDILVATRILEGLGATQARDLVERLRAAQKGRSLVLVLPDGELAGGFDHVMRFERGALVAPAPAAVPTSLSA
jgi:ABC-type multidrug transport system fused ATPase/permease subunit